MSADNSNGNCLENFLENDTFKNRIRAYHTEFIQVFYNVILL